MFDRGTRRPDAGLMLPKLVKSRGSGNQSGTWGRCQELVGADHVIGNSSQMETQPYEIAAGNQEGRNEILQLSVTTWQEEGTIRNNYLEVQIGV